MTTYRNGASGEILCKAGDVIDVAFTNTDTKTYGVEICTESV